MRRLVLFTVTSAIAGAVAGIFGSGGGLIIVPLLSFWLGNNPDFFCLSLYIMFPIIVTSYIASGVYIPISVSWPYLIGSTLGGLGAYLFQKHISGNYLHCILGLMILWGGIRYLCFGS